MFVQVGQTWESDAGNRFTVTGIVLGSQEGDGKVKVKRIPGRGQDRLPKWEDGLYVFHPSQFQAMTLLS